MLSGSLMITNKMSAFPLKNQETQNKEDNTRIRMKKPTESK